jgi:hypothetical protein
LDGKDFPVGSSTQTKKFGPSPRSRTGAIFSTYLIGGNFSPVILLHLFLPRILHAGGGINEEGAQTDLSLSIAKKGQSPRNRTARKFYLFFAFIYFRFTSYSHCFSHTF